MGWFWVGFGAGVRIGFLSHKANNGPIKKRGGRRREGFSQPPELENKDSNGERVRLQTRCCF